MCFIVCSSIHIHARSSTSTHTCIEWKFACNGFRIVNIVMCKTCVIILVVALKKQTTICMSWIISFWCWIYQSFLFVLHVEIFLFLHRTNENNVYFWLYLYLFYFLLCFFFSIPVCFVFSSFHFWANARNCNSKRTKSTKDETACTWTYEASNHSHFSVFWFVLFSCCAWCE